MVGVFDCFIQYLDGADAQGMGCDDRWSRLEIGIWSTFVCLKIRWAVCARYSAGCFGVVVFLCMDILPVLFSMNWTVILLTLRSIVMLALGGGCIGLVCSRITRDKFVSHVEVALNCRFPVCERLDNCCRSRVSNQVFSGVHFTSVG